MAEGKKSFIAYSDWKDTFDALEDDKAGLLIKHIFSYVNDENPQTDDPIIKAVFQNIKNTLKRDLKKWDKQYKQRVEAGKKSAEVRKRNATVVNARSVSSTVSVSGSVSVSEIIDKSITYTKNDFLLDWNVLRLKHLNKPSFLNTLRGEDLDNFKDLVQDYKQEDFQFALIGLFKQKKLPNDNKVMQSNPKHFLKYFNTYLTAYHDKNTALYGENKKEY